MIKIEFDSVDGAGKTTALKYFAEQARQRGLIVVETREVGNPHVPSCVKMREFVLDPTSNLTGEAMECIFSAMRFENDKWFNDLANSETPPDLVVSDRGWYSHKAYTDHNVSEEFTELLYDGVMSVKTALPDVVIYFEVDTEVALKRRVKRGTGMDVIEMKGIQYQEDVRESFEKYLDADCDDVDIYSVDANGTIEEVQAQLNKILDDLVETFELK
ncbi:MAG TPA: dTMP kinase [Candidatus Acidoferrum sp.]|nr:dTMP kinase [Candidatus Acidoferrum sp.]